MLLSASRDLYVRSAGVSSRSAASAIDLNDSVGAPIEFRQARADDALIGKRGTGLPHARSLGSGKLPIFVHIVLCPSRASTIIDSGLIPCALCSLACLNYGILRRATRRHGVVNIPRV